MTGSAQDCIRLHLGGLGVESVAPAGDWMTVHYGAPHDPDYDDVDDDGCCYAVDGHDLCVDATGHSSLDDSNGDHCGVDLRPSVHPGCVHSRHGRSRIQTGH